MPPAKNSRGQDALLGAEESFPWHSLMRANSIFTHISFLENPKLRETPAWGDGK